VWLTWWHGWYRYRWYGRYNSLAIEWHNRWHNRRYWRYNSLAIEWHNRWHNRRYGRYNCQPIVGRWYDDDRDRNHYRDDHGYAVM
jgi:hypothetical protein